MSPYHKNIRVYSNGAESNLVTVTSTRLSPTESRIENTTSGSVPDVRKPQSESTDVGNNTNN